VLSTAMGARGNRAGEGKCEQREDRESQDKDDDHDSSLYLRQHAGDQRSPFVLRALEGLQNSLVGTKIDKCHCQATIFRATVLW